MSVTIAPALSYHHGSRSERRAKAALHRLLYEQTESEGTTQDDGPDQDAALSTAPLVIVPLASKDMYLDRYAQPGKGWTVPPARASDRKSLDELVHRGRW